MGSRGFDWLNQQVSGNRDALDALSVEDLVSELHAELADDRIIEARSTRRRPAAGADEQLTRALAEVPYDDGLFRPQTRDQVRALVERTAKLGTILRTVGAGHSVAAAIYPGEPQGILLSLGGELRHLDYLEKTPEHAVVRVGAGCYLGVNPDDESSTLENSLSYQLASQGFALPVTGGITHQSLGGFLQTGSAGGSLSYGFADSIEEIELVDGRGELVRLGRGSDELNAVGVGMGLFGVITSVTLRVPANYFVRGTEVNVELGDSFVALEAGRSRLLEQMTQNEYLHLNWFPQRHVQRVMQWTGNRTLPTAESAPYENALRNRLVALIAAFILKVESGMLQIDADSEVVQETIGFLMKKFLPLNQPQDFCDVWYKTLPTDDQVLVDSLIKTYFTEVWLPVEQTDAALARLSKLFDDELAAGNFAVEIYSAKRSPFWLSAAHERDVVRIDPYWWAHNFGSPEDYFTRYWNALIDLPGARLHWGKYLPKPGQVCAGISFRRPFLEAAFPKFSEWLELRAKFDPNQLFLSEYWRNALEIPKAD